MIKLLPEQLDAVKRMHNGCVLCGGVGSGKSLTSLMYYREKVYPTTKDIVIITTAKKRNEHDWEGEVNKSILDLKPNVEVDSWNNVHKYVGKTGCFFIFDEQRVVGSGDWVTAFLKITKHNQWILLSATPGDCWLDYIPLFIANGYYKNRTEFSREHVVYCRFCKYPKVERYLNVSKLMRLRDSMLVTMDVHRDTVRKHKVVDCKFDETKINYIMQSRKDPYTKKPLKDAGALCLLSRQIVNKDPSRLDAVRKIVAEHNKVIIFYNYDFELEILKQLEDTPGLSVAEYNGHHHQQIPQSDRWVYLVQYTAGAEGWNCVETDTIVFYSQTYSYKVYEQAQGRIDRMNTKFKELFYYDLRSKSFIDQAIWKCLKNKKNFNESRYMDF